MSLTFASLHRLMALVASNEIAAAHELVAASEREAGSGLHDQARVLNVVGRDVAHVILGLATGRTPHIALDRLATRLRLVGGSHAQRDVFMRTLATLAADQGDRATLEAVLSVRRRLKQDDRFAALVQDRLDRSERRLRRRRA
jgi:hypothetical protein